MIETPSRRSSSGSSLTRRRASKVALGIAPPEDVKAVLQTASSGTPMDQRLQTILETFEHTMAEADDYVMSTEAMRDPIPRHGAFVHPSDLWYQVEIAMLLRKALRGADEAARNALAMAFRAGELFKEMDLEGPGQRLDRAAVQKESVKAQGTAAADTSKAAAARLYAPALAEAELRWRAGKVLTAKKLAEDLHRDSRFKSLPKRSLELRLRTVLKNLVRDHSASDA